MPLNEDRIRALEARTQIPPVTVPNAHLGGIGQDSEGFDVVAWLPVPDKELSGHGDPNGEVVASKGDLYRDRDAPGLWQNADGDTAWESRSGAFSIQTAFYDDSWATTTPFTGSWSGNAEWPTTLAEGDALLDFVSGPFGAETPVVLTDGLYTFDVSVGTDNDTDPYGVAITAFRPPGTVIGFKQLRGFLLPFPATTPTQIAPIGLTTAMLAGDFVVVVVQGGGVANIALSATVSRIGSA